MAKLPENFVKGPVGRRSGKPARTPSRARRANLALETTECARDILVHLSPEEYEALRVACAALGAMGEQISIEQMIKDVINRWIAATRASCAVDRAPVAELPEPARQTILSHLQRIAGEPVRRWRELALSLRRLSRSFLGAGAG